MPTLPKIITRTLSLKLSLMAVCEISLLLMVALAVMFHYSRCGAYAGGHCTAYRQRSVECGTVGR